MTLGVDADTHEAIVTGHHGSKFGLPPERHCRSLERSLARGIDVLGLHVHVGSQLADFAAQAETIRTLAAFAARCRESLGWEASGREPRVEASGSGITPRRGAVAPPSSRRPPRARSQAHGTSTGCPAATLARAGPCLVGRAGVTLYRVGSVKRLQEGTWVAVDGGMSDNPRPQLYDARYTALSALRATRSQDELVSVAGMHCESGDVLIDDVSLPTPRPGDLLAVPATGAYTLAMSSNYNGVTRPAAVLVRDGEARVIRRRETSTTCSPSRPTTSAPRRPRPRSGPGPGT